MLPTSESGDELAHAGPARSNQVDARRAVPVENIASSRELGSAPSAERTAPKVAEAPGLQQLRSPDLHLLVSDRAAYSGCAHDCRAGNRCSLASRWLSPVLAVEVSTRSGQAQGASRSSAADPRDEPRQPSLGRSPHSWRAPQARHRRGPNLRRQVHGPTKAPAVAGLENIPSKSCRWDRLD